jgi:hypothetical protein
MTLSEQRPPKWIHRAPQDAAPEETLAELRPRPVRHFEIKERETKLEDVSGADLRDVPVHHLGSDLTGSSGDRIPSAILPDPASSNSYKYTGDWLQSTAGKVLGFLFLVVLAGGVLSGGTYLWLHNRAMLLFALLILMLLAGVISAGLELGEHSPFRWPGHFVGWYHWWW